MVNDTGTGIESNDMSQLFDTFFTTKPEGKGTGLGLPTVKRIVEAHSGFIEINSTLGEGTSFEVFLPRFCATPTATPTVEQVDPPAGKYQMVLIAGHSVSFGELLGEVLPAHGYRFSMAGTPAEAVEQMVGEGGSGFDCAGCGPAGC